MCLCRLLGDEQSLISCCGFTTKWTFIYFIIQLRTMYIIISVYWYVGYKASVEIGEFNTG